MSVSIRDEDPHPSAFMIVPTAAPAPAMMTPTALLAGIEDRRRQTLPSDLRDGQVRRGDAAATGISLFCIAAGAFLYFVVTNVVSAVGVILMIAGGLGLVASDLVLAKARRARIGERQ